jgi:hypothetical protein
MYLDNNIPNLLWEHLGHVEMNLLNMDYPKTLLK